MLVETMNLLLVSILEDDPQAISTITFSSNGLFTAVAINDLELMHR
jgi:hypothetical protein